MKTCFRAVGTLATAMICLFATSATALAEQTITSAGPLTNVYLGEFLDCQADHTGDLAHEFFGEVPGACGTFIAPEGTTDPEEVYGPDVPAGVPRNPYTEVSQSAVTGAGTSASPFQVLTIVDVGETGLRIRQTDSYVVGDEFYRTDIEVLNTTGADMDAVLYHAADCFLQDSDDGYGFLDPVGGGIYCSENPDNTPTGRIEGFAPLSPGSQYIESEYEAVWLSLDGSPLPNTCDCDLLQDNGAGISWEITVPANGSVTRSLLTTFSPTGEPPPPPDDDPTELTLSPPSATNAAGEEHCVTATARTATGTGTAGVTVRFSVSGANSVTESVVTGAGGEAPFCYQGQTAGTDVISAFADVDGNGAQGPSEPGATASKTYVAAAPRLLEVTPSVATNVVETTHCLTATVTDAFRNPNAGVTVRFRVDPEGPDDTVVASGAVTTDQNGRTQFCYTGPALPRVDVVGAFVDTDGSGTFNGEEPGFAGRKTWVLPESNCGVKVTGGGWIQTAGGWGHLNVNVKTKNKHGLDGKVRFSSRGIDVSSWDILVQTCSDGNVTLFGIATVNGSRQHQFRLDIADGGNPGRDNDTIRIRTDTGYDSGTGSVQRGNIKVHKK